MNTPERFRTRLGEGLIAHAADRSFAPDRDIRPVRRLRVPLGVRTATIVGAATVAVVLLLASRGSVSPPPASAASVLRASASALERTAPALTLAARTYLYTRTLNWWRNFDAPNNAVVLSVSETWTERNGAGRTRSRVLKPSRSSRRFSYDERLRASAHPYALDNYVQVTYSELQHLPADPGRLAAVVGRLADRDARGYGGSPPRGWHTTLVFGILHKIAVSPAPSAVRAAVYRAMARTPRIRLIGTGRDALGRAGKVFVDTVGPFRLELIIDPATGRLLQWSRSLLHRSAQVAGWRPGLINRTTYEAIGVVPSTHSRSR
jgi:hypothetical protein